MGTIWGYRVRYPQSNFNDLTANAVLAQAPLQVTQSAAMLSA